MREKELEKSAKNFSEKYYATSASCCLVRPPLRRSSNRLPTRGQLVGPGIASRLWAREAAWGHRAASRASFSSRTHTEDVGLKCCSPTDFCLSSSTIWGAFFICALILTNAFMSVPEQSLQLCLCYLSHFSFLGSVTPSRQYIPPECSFLRAQNQSATSPAWCGRRAHHSFMDPCWEDRMTPERPRKCPPPAWLYK